MRRLRRFTWLLWLFVALLPVRGMAMGTFAPLTDLSTAVVLEQAPCPLHASSASPDAAPAKACALCDVCHLVAMPVADIDSPSDAKPQAAPLPQLGLGAGRAPAEALFRPPR